MGFCGWNDSKRFQKIFSKHTQHKSWFKVFCYPHMTLSKPVISHIHADTLLPRRWLQGAQWPQGRLHSPGSAIALAEVLLGRRCSPHPLHPVPQKRQFSNLDSYRINGINLLAKPFATLPFTGGFGTPLTEMNRKTMPKERVEKCAGKMFWNLCFSKHSWWEWKLRLVELLPKCVVCGFLINVNNSVTRQISRGGPGGWSIRPPMVENFGGGFGHGWWVIDRGQPPIKIFGPPHQKWTPSKNKNTHFLDVWKWTSGDMKEWLTAISFWLFPPPRSRKPGGK